MTLEYGVIRRTNINSFLNRHFPRRRRRWNFSRKQFLLLQKGGDLSSETVFPIKLEKLVHILVVLCKQQREMSKFSVVYGTRTTAAIFS